LLNVTVFFANQTEQVAFARLEFICLINLYPLPSSAPLYKTCQDKFSVFLPW